MASMENVIRGLEYHLKELSVGKTCFKCPYCGNNPCEIHLISDALELLKEREAVKPTLIREGWKKHYNDYVCPRCDNEVVYEQNYCTECGTQFLWEGR